MKPRFRNITGRDLTLCLNGPTFMIRKDGIIEGEQFARFVGAGGLRKVEMLNEPVVKSNVLDIPESKADVITEPIKVESVIDVPKVVENIITETVTVEAPKKRGRPAGSKNISTK